MMYHRNCGTTALLLVAGLSTAGACKRVPVTPAGTAPVVTLAFITGLQGVLAPRGCPPDELGGLDRIAARVEALREEGPFALFVVGDTFFAPGEMPASLFEQEQQGADTIAAILGRLAPAAILVGPGDHGAHREQILRLAQKYGLAVLASPRSSAPRQLKLDNAVREVGGLGIAYLGAPGDPGSEILSYAAGAVALRAQRPAIVIGLVGVGRAGAEPVMRRTGAINVIVTGGGDEPEQPAMVGNTLVVTAGNRGRSLGLLRLHPDPNTRPTPGDWLYDDGRRTYPDPRDPSVLVPRPPPEGSTVTWEIEPICPPDALGSPLPGRD